MKRMDTGYPIKAFTTGIRLVLLTCFILLYLFEWRLRLLMWGGLPPDFAKPCSPDQEGEVSTKKQGGYWDLSFFIGGFKLQFLICEIGHLNKFPSNGWGCPCTLFIELLLTTARERKVEKQIYIPYLVTISKAKRMQKIPPGSYKWETADTSKVNPCNGQQILPLRELRSPYPTELHKHLLTETASSQAFKAAELP